MAASRNSLHLHGLWTECSYLLPDYSATETPFPSLFCVIWLGSLTKAHIFSTHSSSTLLDKRLGKGKCLCTTTPTHGYYTYYLSTYVREPVNEYTNMYDKQFHVYALAGSRKACQTTSNPSALGERYRVSGSPSTKTSNCSLQHNGMGRSHREGAAVVFGIRPHTAMCVK